MLNIIRADMYRIVRGKALYITLAVLLGTVALIVCTQQEMMVGIQMKGLEGSLGYDADSLRYNGMNIASVLYTSMDNLAYFIIPLVILVAAPMFSHGTLKNSLASGMSRTKIYFAKLIVSSILSALTMLLYMTFGIILATAIRGFGGTPDADYWLNILKIIGAQFIIMLALNCVGMFLVFTTKRTAIVTATFIAFCLVPSIVMLLLSNVNTVFFDLYNYDLIGCLKLLGYLNALEFSEVIRTFVTGAFYITVTTAAGVALFRRAEIK